MTKRKTYLIPSKLDYSKLTGMILGTKTIVVKTLKCIMKARYSLKNAFINLFISKTIFNRIKEPKKLQVFAKVLNLGFIFSFPNKI